MPFTCLAPTDPEAKGKPMADTSPLDGLLDRARSIFTLADDLGRAFQDEHRNQGRTPIDPRSWDCHEPTVDELFDALVGMKDSMQNPPTHFEPVADALWEAVSVVRAIREKMRTADGRRWADYRDYFPQLNGVARDGLETITKITKAIGSKDPLAFIDPPTVRPEVKIDTTPMLPEPPADSINSASREIPCILTNVKPRQYENIEMIASYLAKRLQDAGHILAAAYWAIHQSINAGRLRAALVEIELPSFASRNPVQGGPGLIWHGGEKGTVAIPKCQPTPFDCFKVVATESLWEWWRSIEKQNPTVLGGGSCGDKIAVPQAGVIPPAKPPKPKRSTEKGEARIKLIAALTAHHKYADGSSLNLEPIGNNELARKANVANRSTSRFFKESFKGYASYRIVCHNGGRLSDSLKVLNDEFAPHDLYGRRPPNEDDRTNEDA